MSPSPAPDNQLQQPSALPPSPPATTPLSSQPSSQLALFLASALRDNESLKRENSSLHRKLSKAERIVAAVQVAGRSTSPNGTPQPNGAQLPESAVKAIAECESRAERAERARDEAEGRLQAILSQWAEYERYLSVVDLRVSEAREAFARHAASLASQSSPSSDSPGPSASSVSTTATLSFVPPPRFATQVLPPTPSNQHHFSQRRLVSIQPTLPQPPYRSSFTQNAAPFQQLPLPPPPSATGPAVVNAMAKRSHRRPRGDDWESSGSNKRSRVDDGRDERAKYSESPTNSPHIANNPSPPYPTDARTQIQIPTGHMRQPLVPADLINGILKGSDQHPSPSHNYSHQQMIRQRQQQQHALLDHPEYQPLMRGRSRERERGGTDRERRRRRDRSSSATSAASSLSIDEMLLAVSTADPSPNTHHRQQILQANGNDRDGYSPGSAGGNGAMAAPNSASLNGKRAPGVSDATLTARPDVGPHREPPSLQTYQTHIFAPPVTGAPMKKNKSVPANQLVTLGPGGNIVSGGGAATALPTSALPGGGYPATNASGQRICRQCGMAGRYKDGKCVEKWGPGPEGPGTVCDRCRKKMKRVERKGTMDAAQLHQHQQHQAALAASAAQANGATVSASHGSSNLNPNVSNVHVAVPPTRQDTVLVQDRDGRQSMGAKSTYNPYGDRDLMVPSPSAGGRPGSVQAQVNGHLMHAQPQVIQPQSASSTNGNGLYSSPTNGTGGRRQPTPPIITSISTREQYASGGGSRGSSPSGDEDGEGEDGEHEGDRGTARPLPGNSDRPQSKRNSTTAGTPTSAGGISGGPPSSGAKRAFAYSMAPSQPQSPRDRHVNGNGTMNNGGKKGSISSLAPVNSATSKPSAGPSSTSTTKKSPLSAMDVDDDNDAEGEGEDEADADEEILSAVNASSKFLDELESDRSPGGIGGRVKKEVEV